MRQLPIALLLFAFAAACNSTNDIPRTVLPGPSTAPSGKVDTEFIVDGRYIDLKRVRLDPSAMRPAAATKFFLKGLVYWPTPIGKHVSDAPMLDDALRDGNEAVWARDLPLIRAAGANAIHVYNVVPPGFDKETGPITKFLDASWNGGKKPVYVLMSIHFTGEKLLNDAAVKSLATQYHDLDEKYAKYPAVFGVSISNEIGADNFITNAKWWQGFNTVAKAAKKGFADAGDPDKIVTTSEPDGEIGFVKAGEKFGAAVDAWGINVYRGRTFTSLFKELKQTTSKPTMLTEYGASAAYHVDWTNTYDWRNGINQLGACHPDKQAGPDNRDVKELPKNGDPGMPGLVDLVWNNGRWLSDGFEDGGVLAGGFYFEWNDEWWKSGNKDKHVGNIAFNGHYPGCSNDEAWFGLNSVSRGSGVLDVLTPRPTLKQITQSWAAAP
ncbi:MAG TPA: hypothetical protein VIX83_00505 [Candidatus Cybelea sp.]